VNKARKKTKKKQKRTAYGSQKKRKNDQPGGKQKRKTKRDGAVQAVTKSGKIQLRDRMKGTNKISRIPHGKQRSIIEKGHAGSKPASKDEAGAD